MRLVSLLAAVSAALAADGGVKKSLAYAKTGASTKEVPQELRNLEIPPMLLPGCHKVSELWSNSACGFIASKSLASPPIAFSSAVPFKAAIHAPEHVTDPLAPKSVQLVLEVVEGTIFPFLSSSESSVSVPTFVSNADETQYTATWKTSDFPAGLELSIKTSPQSTHSVEDMDAAASITYTFVENHKKVGGPSSNPTPLNSGATIFDYVAQNAFQYYSFNIPTASLTRIDISASPVFGDPDMYVSLNGLASMTNKQYSSITGDVDLVTITSADPAVAQYCPPTVTTCAISIAIYGWRASNYSITATSASGSATLTVGFPFFDAVGSMQYNYYVANAAITTGVVAFTLTPFSGDPDMFIANSQVGNPRPTMADASSYCAYSNTMMQDVVEIYPGNACYCTPPCTYYVGIFGYGAASASYSLIFTEFANATTRLINGIPQSGFLTQGHTDQYALTVVPEPGRQTIEITLVPYLGDPDLYITLDGSVPTVGNWQYRSISGSGVDYVPIRTTDTAYINTCGKTPLAPCTINIAVFAFTTAVYTIVGTSGRYTQLQDGRQLTDSVDGNSYAYFRFTSSMPNARVVITVQPLSGDPDLYVGSDFNATQTGQPTNTPGTYFWRRIGVTTEVLTIFPNDPYACTPPCNYYIAVLGFQTNCTFTIIAKTISNTPTPLIIGQPMTDLVGLQGYNYYSAAFNNPPLTITVSPIFGDPDLFVRLDNQSLTNQNFQYSSTAMSGVEMVNIQATDVPFTTNCANTNQPCIATIAVYGFSQAGYTVTASTGVTSLLDGVVTYGEGTSNQYVYYSFIVSNWVPITIAVTPITGDPDLFVSTINQTPNITSNQWRSNGFGNEVIYISTTDPKFINCSIPCVFYIGVLAWGRASSFSISARTSPVALLTPGVPAIGFAPAWTMSYFYLFNRNNTVGLEFVATPLSGGDISIYVNSQVDGNGQVILPTLTCSPVNCPNWAVVNSQWSSVDSVSREEVAFGPLAQGTGMYAVGILSMGQDSEFSITGAVWGSVITLQPNVPFQAYAAQSQYNYYRLALTTPYSDVSLTVTAMFGNADLFVSYHATNPYPNQTNADKKAQGNGRIDAIYLPWDLFNNSCPIRGGVVDCDIWISVYGVTNTSYTITPVVVDVQNVTSMLIDGVPSSAQLPYHQYAYYYVDVNVPQGTTYSVYVRPVSGNPNLYIRTDGQQPSNSFYQVSSMQTSGDEVINIAPGASYYCNRCTMRIAVYAFTAAIFQITYSSSAAVVQLADGVSQFGTLPGNQPIYQYYSFAIGNSQNDITFSLTSLSGDPDIYVSEWTTPQTRPTSQSYTWSGTFYGSDTVVIPARTTCSYCQLIAGVLCAVGTSCRYSLTATQTAATLIQLSDGQPLTNSVGNQQWKYFTFDTGGNATLYNLTVQVVASTGNAQLYMTNWYQTGDSAYGQLPNNAPGGYIWSSASGGGSSGNGIVNIPFYDPNVRWNATTYTIGVYGVFGPATFTITATTTLVPQSLVPGQPSTQHVITAGQMQMYSIAVVDLTQDFIAVVTLMDGSSAPIIAVSSSSSQSQPTCSSASACSSTWWNGAAGTPGQLRISAASPCTGLYVNNATTCTSTSDWVTGQFFVGVYGTAASATYSISVFESAAFQQLIDGQPQQGSTTSTTSAVFNFQTDYDTLNPDIRFTITASTLPLVFYINSCTEAACTATSQAPGPSNYAVLGTADAQTSTDFFISRYSNAYCSDYVNQGICNYFISVEPLTSCTGTCVATFGIVAAKQDGQLTRITLSSIQNRVLTQPGNIPAGNAAIFELYLDPTVATSVQLNLDSCGPGAPNLYVCNPTATGNRCSNPFQPTYQNNTGSASTKIKGIGQYTDPTVQASNYFIAVSADGMRDFMENQALVTTADDKVWLSARSNAMQQQPNWAYALSVSTGNAPILWPGMPSVLSIQPAGVSVTLTWNPATVGTFNTPGTKAQVGVTYVVFAAQTGFSNTAGTVPTTPCGLYRWASLNQFEPVSVVNQTFAVVNNLQPNTQYEFNVIASCDKTCWALNGLSDAEAQAAADADEDNLAKVYAPGYNIQRVTYIVMQSNTGNAPSPPTSTSFPPAGIAAICVALLVVGGAGFGYARYRRKKAYDHLDQYNSVDVLDAMDTISTPASRGGGFLASMRGMLKVPRSAAAPSGSLNSSYGRNDVGLADSSYSTLDDRANAYL